MPDIPQFAQPVRTAVALGINQPEYVNGKDAEDQESDLDLNDRFLEDYMNAIVPRTYIAASAPGSGIIDPTQLASGTPTTGYAPVYDGTEPVWVDIATQAELNTAIANAVNDGDSAGGDLAGTYPSPTIATATLKRGTVAWTLGVADTNTSTTVIFSGQFAANPVVTLAVLNSAGLNLGAELTSVTTAQFVVRVFPTAGVALGSASGSVHWHAIKV